MAFSLTAEMWKVFKTCLSHEQQQKQMHSWGPVHVIAKTLCITVSPYMHSLNFQWTSQNVAAEIFGSGCPADYVNWEASVCLQYCCMEQKTVPTTSRNNRCIKHTPYVPDDLVWSNDPTTVKWNLHYIGRAPFEILESLWSDKETPGVTFKICCLLDQLPKSQIIHYNLLRPYNGPNFPQSWDQITCWWNISTVPASSVDCIIRCFAFQNIKIHS